MKPRRVVVVGAGVGGLVAALELAAQGLEVTLLEQAETPGGKLRELQPGKRAMDAGPTVFTMRWVFDDLFASIGERLDEHLGLQPLEVLARHAWGPGEQLDLFADIERTVAAIDAFSGAAEGRRYRHFCARAAAIFAALEVPFLRAQRPSPAGLVLRAGWRGLPALLRISPFATLWGEMLREFRDPRLVQLFGRYATYCGSSPWLAPATLMLVAHVEREGVWAIAGGMHRLAACLAGLARQHGAWLRFGTAVADVAVQGGRASGVRLESGERIDADAVVFNGDAAALAAGRLGDAARAAVKPVPATRRSLSALVWNVDAPAQGFPLLRHNVFFSADYAAEFDDLFKHGRLPRRPTVYVCAQDRDDDGGERGGRPERLLVLVNAPACGDAADADKLEVASCQEQTLAALARCGLTTGFDPKRTLLTRPAEFERLFPATGGALYGQASHGWQSSFQRPPSRSRLPGLYLAGGSTHPGPGVPMAALSGRLAAAGLLADLKRMPRASTSPSRAAATPGGTSTR